MQKIMIITNSIPGLISFRHEVISELTISYDVVIVAPYSNRISKLLEIGCDYFELDFQSHGKNIIKELKVIFKTKRIIEKIKPSTILTYTIKPNIYVGLINQFNSSFEQIANITGLGNSIMNNQKSLFSRLMLTFYSFSIRSSSKVFAQNEQIYSIMKQAREQLKLELLPGSGVNLEKFQYNEMKFHQNERVITFLGRVIPEKGINELLRSIELLNNMKTKYKYKFNIIGNNILQLSSMDNVTIKSTVTDVRDEIFNSHVIINPSYHEGMSNVLLEGASSGRMLMSSNIYGCKEILGDWGILFEPRSSESMLEAFLILDNMSNHELKTRGKKLRKHVEENFSRDIVIAKYSEAIGGNTK